MDKEEQIWLVVNHAIIHEISFLITCEFGELVIELIPEMAESGDNGSSLSEANK